MTEKTRSIFIDLHASTLEVPRPDDFIVAIGHAHPRKTNSCYLIASCREVHRRTPTPRRRFQLQVYPCGLQEVIRRDPDQLVFTMTWYSRSGKK